MAFKTMQEFTSGFLGAAREETGLIVAETAMRMVRSAIAQRAAGNKTENFETLVAAAKLFTAVVGDRPFSSWILAQTHSTSISIAHLQFLSETCEYIATGRRKHSHVVYAGLICLGSNVSVSDVMRRKLFTLAERVPHSNEYDLSGVITAWIARENGVEDFYHTLAILYGEPVKRDVPTD